MTFGAGSYSYLGSYSKFIAQDVRPGTGLFLLLSPE
jgi:hypothetical protein